MSEAGMRSLLIQRMVGLDAVAIESPKTGIGIPDVNFKWGWIECKWLKTWPVNAETRPVKFPHPLTKHQQLWLWRRERAGGLAMVCAKVSNSWFFWSGAKIKERNLWDNMTKPQMYQEAAKVFEGKLEPKELVNFLHLQFLNSHSESIF